MNNNESNFVGAALYLASLNMSHKFNQDPKPDLEAPFQIHPGFVKALQPSRNHSMNQKVGGATPARLFFIFPGFSLRLSRGSMPDVARGNPREPLI